MIHLATFSVAAHCAETGQMGVAVSTAVPAVGSICSFVFPRVGAIATQSWVNPYLGIDGLALLKSGLSSAETLAQLLDNDDGRDVRQLAIIDAVGGVSQHSGSACTEWFGHRQGDGFAVQGNMLTGAEVIDAMAASMNQTANQPLRERLMAALEAGQAAGGDMRGKQSASLKVHADEEYPLLDLRVDAHADPVTELRRVYEIAKTQFLPFVVDMPTRDDVSSSFSKDVKQMLMKAPDER